MLPISGLLLLVKKEGPGDEATLYSHLQNMDVITQTEAKVDAGPAGVVRPVRPWPDHFLASALDKRIAMTFKTRNEERDWFVNICSISANLCARQGAYVQMASSASLQLGSVTFTIYMKITAFSVKSQRNVKKSPNDMNSS